MTTCNIYTLSSFLCHIDTCSPLVLFLFIWSTWIAGNIITCPIGYRIPSNREDRGRTRKIMISFRGPRLGVFCCKDGILSCLPLGGIRTFSFMKWILLGGIYLSFLFSCLSKKERCTYEGVDTKGHLQVVFAGQPLWAVYFRAFHRSVLPQRQNYRSTPLLPAPLICSPNNPLQADYLALKNHTYFNLETSDANKVVTMGSVMTRPTATPLSLQKLQW